MLTLQSQRLEEHSKFQVRVSTNGQILARRRNKDKVKRIFDFEQIDTLIQISQNGLEQDGYERWPNLRTITKHRPLKVKEN